MNKMNDFDIAKNLSEVLNGNVTFTLVNGVIMVNYPNSKNSLSLDDFLEKYKKCSSKYYYKGFTRGITHPHIAK